MTDDERAERLARLAARRNSNKASTTSAPAADGPEQADASPTAVERPARRRHPAGTSRILVAGGSAIVTLLVVSALGWAGDAGDEGEGQGGGAAPAAAGTVAVPPPAPPNVRIVIRQVPAAPPPAGGGRTPTPAARTTSSAASPARSAPAPRPQAAVAPRAAAPAPAATTSRAS